MLLFLTIFCWTLWWGQPCYRLSWFICNINLHNLYFTPNTVRVIDSQRIRRQGKVALIRKVRNSHNNLVGKPKKMFGRPCQWLTLRRFLDANEWKGFNWLRIRTKGRYLWTRRWTFEFLKRSLTNDCSRTNMYRVLGSLVGWLARPKTPSNYCATAGSVTYFSIYFPLIRYVIIRKLTVSIFHILPIFICRWEIQTHFNGPSIRKVACTKCDAPVSYNWWGLQHGAPLYYSAVSLDRKAPSMPYASMNCKLGHYCCQSPSMAASRNWIVLYQEMKWHTQISRPGQDRRTLFTRVLLFWIPRRYSSKFSVDTNLL